MRTKSPSCSLRDSSDAGAIEPGVIAMSISPLSICFSSVSALMPRNEKRMAGARDLRATANGINNEYCVASTAATETVSSADAGSKVPASAPARRACTDYTRPDAVAAIRAAAGGEVAVDRIIEINFGANIATDLAVIACNGVIASYGSDADPQLRLPYAAFIQKDVTLEMGLIYEAAQTARDAAARQEKQNRCCLFTPRRTCSPAWRVPACRVALHLDTRSGKDLVAAVPGSPCQRHRRARRVGGGT